MINLNLQFLLSMLIKYLMYYRTAHLDLAVVFYTARNNKAYKFGVDLRALGKRKEDLLPLHIKYCFYNFRLSLILYVIFISRLNPRTYRHQYTLSIVCIFVYSITLHFLLEAWPFRVFYCPI